MDPFQNVKNKKEINFGLYKNKELVQTGKIKPDDEQFRSDRCLYFHLLFHQYRRSHFYRNTRRGRRMCCGDELEGFIEEESMLSLEIK